MLNGCGVGYQAYCEGFNVTADIILSNGLYIAGFIIAIALIKASV